MNIKKNKKYIFIVILIFLISIGFAYLSSTLNITGLTRVMGNNWNIYFDNIQYVRGQDFEITAPTTTGTTTTSVSYEVFLPSPGDVYKFNIDIVNAGSLDAMVKVVTDTELTDAQKKYASYYVTYSDGISCDDYQLLPKNSTDTLSVMVAYNRDILEEDLPDTDKSITVTFHIEFEQATSKATARNHITVVNRANNNTLSVGDEIALGDEHFFILETNPESYKLMTKYLLNTDQKKQSGASPTRVKFSNIVYWYNNNSFGSYGVNYLNNVIYDRSKSAETGDNYSVVYHVNNYLNTLDSIDMKYIEGRLLTIMEAYKYGCVYVSGGGNCSAVPDNLKFIYYNNGGNYWLGSFSGSLTSPGYVWNLGGSTTYSYLGGTDTSLENRTQYIRPVIEIPALDI
ncbi:MAG: hypothetical protein Q4E69_02660 [Bacilli bacterium]|nr:hypothetical protein [Bacilli bacterium]